MSVSPTVNKRSSLAREAVKIYTKDLLISFYYCNYIYVLEEKTLWTREKHELTRETKQQQNKKREREREFFNYYCIIKIIINKNFKTKKYWILSLKIKNKKKEKRKAIDRTKHKIQLQQVFLRWEIKLRLFFILLHRDPNWIKECLIF